MPNAIPGNAAIDLAAANAKATHARPDHQDKIELLTKLVKRQRRDRYEDYKSPWT